MLNTIKEIHVLKQHQEMIFKTKHLLHPDLDLQLLMIFNTSSTLEPCNEASLVETVSCSFPTFGILSLSSISTVIIGEDFGCKDLLQTNNVCLCTVPSNSNLSSVLSKIDCIRESECQSSCKETDIQADDMENETTFLQFESSSYLGKHPEFSKPYNSIVESVKKQASPVKLVGTRFSRKSPIIECTDEPGSEAPILPVNGDCDSFTFRQGKSADDFLPFFTSSCPEEKEHQEVGTNCVSTTREIIWIK